LAKLDLVCSAIDKNGLNVDDGYSSIVPKIHHMVFLERAMERNHTMEWRDVKIAVIGNSAANEAGLSPSCSTCVRAERFYTK
jgi:hypothetical protein